MNSLRVGIFGAAVIERPELAPLARRVGAALAATGAIIITGGCSGLPYQAAHEAARQGAEVWGFPPVRNIEEMRGFVPEDDLSIYSRLVYIPESFPFAEDREVCKKYRNVISTAHCDAGIIISGRWGTLHEFINLIDYGRAIGVLTNTGDIADELPGLTARIRKSPGGDESGEGKLSGGRTSKPGESREPVIFGSEPEELVRRLLSRMGEWRVQG